MVRWPLVVLLAVPLVDIVLLVYVAGVIGGVATVALVVLTALIGLLLVRAEGRHTLGRIQRKLATGDVPADELLDGGLLIAAGAFLLTPGLVTDLLGLLLVLPPTRYPVRVALKRWVVVPQLEARSGGFVSGEVYTVGFGGGGEGFGGPGRAGAAAGSDGSSDPGGPPGDDEYDLGPDAYEVEVTVEPEEESGEATGEEMEEGGTGQQTGEEDPENGNA